MLASRTADKLQLVGRLKCKPSPRVLPILRKPLYEPRMYAQENAEVSTFSRFRLRGETKGSSEGRWLRVAISPLDTVYA